LAIVLHLQHLFCCPGCVTEAAWPAFVTAIEHLGYCSGIFRLEFRDAALAGRL
jgi:hypothetical protein